MFISLFVNLLSYCPGWRHSSSSSNRIPVCWRRSYLWRNNHSFHKSTRQRRNYHWWRI